MTRKITDIKDIKCIEDISRDDLEKEMIELRKSIETIKKTIYKDYAALAKKFVAASFEIQRLKQIISERNFG